MSQITWTCHICGRIRPDSKINVHTRPIVVNGNNFGEENIRYCNDSPSCIEKVGEFSFLKKKRK